RKAAMTAKGRGCVKTHFARRVGSLTGKFNAISRLRCVYVAEINAQKWCARVFTQPRSRAEVCRAHAQRSIWSGGVDIGPALPLSLIDGSNNHALNGAVLAHGVRKRPPVPMESSGRTCW